ncbi:helix-turn-helix domain-containing protein [uncultured Azohydromonas sp.]|jgi:hypothetical protein|uniref:helix-turn-helix domain-containing protein n=1 Tax=uncultured Azohydromonas sp. TaxID=487342 RepID=UPI002622749A|nr:helix-turn-helix domain-containing protein [uncultured Azohydromonas sp.]
MKKENAHPNEKLKAGAAVEGSAIFPGSFPVRKATATAEVLMRLLDGEHLTGLDAVTNANTTRLAAVVHALQKEHGWSIERAEKAAGCSDGRMVFVTEYWLHPQAIARAEEAGAVHWCGEVRAARAELRKEAPHARERATRLNTSRRQRQADAQARQCPLLGGAYE